MAVAAEMRSRLCPRHAHPLLRPLQTTLVGDHQKVNSGEELDMPRASRPSCLSVSRSTVCVLLGFMCLGGGGGEIGCHTPA